MKIALRLITFALITVLAYIPLTGSANSSNHFLFTYSVQFTCGTDPQPAIFRVLPGQYASSIALNNLNRKTTVAKITVSLTFPPGGLTPGPVSESKKVYLKSKEAATVACDQLPKDFFPDTDFPPYIQGVVIIESSRRLAVSATHTVAEINEDGILSIKSMDVEKIERVRSF